MDKRFLKAFLTPSRTVIEGYSLYPWCIKYRLWLQAIESPFLSSDRVIEPSDLIIALQVCSERGVGKIGLKEIKAGAFNTLNQERLKESCKQFVDYMDNAGSWPKFYERKDKAMGAGSTLPWELAVVCNLIKNGVNYNDALQMPEPRAIWMSTCFSISAGAELHILSSDDEDLIDSLSKVEEPPKNT
jgi:hypothetical protein